MLGVIARPSSRTGENSPYGMIGRIEETSASFEARSAPRSYPTRTEIAQPNLVRYDEATAGTPAGAARISCPGREQGNEAALKSRRQSKQIEPCRRR